MSRKRAASQTAAAPKRPPNDTGASSYVLMMAHVHDEQRAIRPRLQVCTRAKLTSLLARPQDDDASDATDDRRRQPASTAAPTPCLYIGGCSDAAAQTIKQCLLGRDSIIEQAALVRCIARHYPQLQYGINLAALFAIYSSSNAGVEAPASWLDDADGLRS